MTSRFCCGATVEDLEFASGCTEANLPASLAGASVGRAKREI
jgi:hypothetical protein